MIGKAAWFRLWGNGEATTWADNQTKFELFVHNGYVGSEW